VLDYVRSRPTQLATEVPPAKEEPFSTPRSWHCVSDALHSFGDDIAPDHLDALLFGCLTRDHAVGFKAFSQADPQQVQRAQDPEGRRALALRARRPRPHLLPDAEPARPADQGTVFNDAMRLSSPLWLGVLSLATLVLALGGPKRLPVPSTVSDLAVQLAALHWWRSLKVGELPEQFELPPEIAQWGRLPLEDIAARLRSEPSNEVLDGDWTLTRSPAVALMLPGARPTRWTGIGGQPANRPRRSVRPGHGRQRQARASGAA
jgi:hypothetical protein